MSDPPPSKKPRFDVRNPSALAADALEDDAVLEADEIGRRGAQIKRNAVKIDGYESDSSNEGFNARAEQKAKEKESAAKEDDEDDMFADMEADTGPGDNEVEVGEKARGKKQVKFVDVEEIEGQVDNSTAGGHVKADFLQGLQRGDPNGIDQHEDDVESSSDSEVGEEERAHAGSDEDAGEIGAGGKKKHAPKLDAFNLSNEKEEGGFDQDLNYVRKAVDPDAVHDTWMQGVSKKDMKKAREAEERRDKERRKAMREDDEIILADLFETLIRNLKTGETALEALARLGPKKKKVPKWQKKKRGDMDVDKAPEETDPEEVKRSQAVEAITGAADKLLGRGNLEIYDTERERVMRLYKRETGEDFVDEVSEPSQDAEQKQWEYRWSDARDGGETHGPYDSTTMSAWNGAGYFGEGVEFRVVGEDSWQVAVDTF